MVPVANKRIIFKECSTGLPIPGQTTVLDASQMIDLENIPLNGGILVKTLVLSLEPYVLFKMSSKFSNTYTIGEPIENSGIAVVVRSESPTFQAGDHLHGFLPFAEYSVLHDIKGFNKIDNKYNLPWSVFVGIAGLAGMTAYSGWKEYSYAKKGEIAFVSSGAGAVGSLVIQLAKRDGMKVIASAGSDDKVQFMKDLGADVAFNYKTTKTSDVLAKEGPIDVYWDNVGGETLSDALNAAAIRARFIECGMVSGYGGNLQPITNFMNVITRDITIYGCRLFSLMSKYREDFAREVPALLASKELTHKEHVTKGLENAEEAFVRFMKGEFIGKSIVTVAEE